MILVFGRTGQVARHLQALADVTALGRAEADLTDPEACAAAIGRVAPAAVINAAAWTGVDTAEDHEAEARLVNAKSPGAMARACAAQGIPFLHVSTDYVFDGTGTRAWRETDLPAPRNAYGRTKLTGERAVAAAGGRHVILRTAWVFSAHGTNFVKTMLRLAQSRTALRVVDDQIGGPTPAADIAATLLHMTHALQDGHAGGLYHYAGAPAVSWAGFARETFTRAGRAVHVDGIPSADYQTRTARPLNSRLDCAQLSTDFGIMPPDWKAGLSAVLKALDER